MDERLEAISHWWESTYDEETKTAVYLFCEGMAKHCDNKTERAAQERRAALRIT